MAYENCVFDNCIITSTQNLPRMSNPFLTQAILTGSGGNASAVDKCNVRSLIHLLAPPPPPKPPPAAIPAEGSTANVFVRERLPRVEKSFVFKTRSSFEDEVELPDKKSGKYLKAILRL